MKSNDATQKFSLGRDNAPSTEEIIMAVFNAMKEKGYDPINQIVGYVISGDPTYITSHQNARYLIQRIERDELLEEFVRFYMAQKDGAS